MYFRYNMCPTPTENEQCNFFQHVHSEILKFYAMQIKVAIIGNQRNKKLKKNESYD